MKTLAEIKDWHEMINEVVWGDCLEGMKLIPDKSIDLILTDPPYDKETHAGGRFGASKEFGNVSFAPIDVVPIVSDFLRICKGWIVIFTSIEQLGFLRQKYPMEYIRGGIWDRIQNSPQISGDRPAQGGEGIAILHQEGKKLWNGGGKAGIWRFMVERGHKQHETQKPLNLIRQLVVDFSQENDLVLDPFMGSWTTARAAKDLGRNFIGFELSEAYCKIGEERLRQQNLF